MTAKRSERRTSATYLVNDFDESDEDFAADEDESRLESEDSSDDEEEVLTREQVAELVRQAVAAARADVQSIKDREIARHLRQTKVLQSDLETARTLLDAYKGLVPDDEDVAPARRTVQNLESTLETTRNRRQAELDQEDAKEQAQAKFEAKWRDTMEELDEDATEYGLGREALRAAVDRYRGEFYEREGDFDWLRRQVRGYFRSATNKKGGSEETPRGAPKRTAVPVKRQAQRPNRASRDIDPDNMTDEEFLDWTKNKEQEYIDSI